MTVTVDDVVEVFPRPLTPGEMVRAEALVTHSRELIGMEFARRGRDLDAELVARPWLAVAVKQAVLQMVSQAVLVGEDTGRASVSSTTGPQSDSVTYSQGVSLKWGGVGIDSDILALLGLGGSAFPLGRGGRVVPYGRSGRLFGAEFSDRGWSR